MIEILTCEQGSPEWYAARLGIPTASEFATVMAKGRDGGASKTRKTYMLKLIGEVLTGEPMDSYENHHMERGKAMEQEARDMYAFMQDVTPMPVGFLKHPVFGVGCSPDSLVRDDGLLEIKTKLAHLQVEALLDGNLPAEHKAQCQGQLWVSGRKWLDFVSYWPKLPPLIVRVQRDEAYIDGIARAVKEFQNEMNHLLVRIRTGYRV